MGDASDDRPAPDGLSPKTEQLVSLLGAHERSLFAYVYSLSPCWQDAEEIMQRVRIRIWQQFDQYDADRPFEAWARAIAYYLVLTFRKEKHRRREIFTESVLEQLSDKFPRHVDESPQRRDALLKCLGRLDNRKRELVRRYYSSTHESGEEVARQFSMTPNALRQALFRIRRILYDCVQRAIRAESHE